MTKTVEELAPTTAKSCRELYVACCGDIEDREQHDEVCRMLEALTVFVSYEFAEHIENYVDASSEDGFEEYMECFKGLSDAELFGSDFGKD